MKKHHNQPRLSLHTGLFASLFCTPTFATIIVDDDLQGNGDQAANIGLVDSAWEGWGGNGVPADNYFNGLLDPANDDDAGVGGPTDQLPLEALNDIVPYANDGFTPAVTYSGAIAEGIYTIRLQVTNWSNAPFPGIGSLTFGGLAPSGSNTPAPSAGDDEIWIYTFVVPNGDPAIGNPLNFVLPVITPAGNLGIDHLEIDFEGDTDGDGLSDSFEQLIIDDNLNDSITSFADVLPGDDYDSDFSTNLQESTLGTDPTDNDSDDDNLWDGYETGTLIYNSPTDTGTNPLLPDSDGDGLNDDVENNSGTWVSISNPGTNPNDSDTDDDGLLDGVENNDGTFVDESRTGTDPHDADSDGDLTDDGDEVANETNPNDPSEGGSLGNIAGQQLVTAGSTAPDGWAICYIDEARPFRLDGGSSTATSFSFYAAPQSLGGGGHITPFIAEVIAPNDFIVRAIGTTRIEGVDWFSEGVQTFAFHDTETPLIQDRWVAGFITANPDGSNSSNGIVPYTANTDIDGWLTGTANAGDPGGITVGLAPEEGISGTSLDAFGQRDYSFQIVADPASSEIVTTNIVHDAAANTTELTWTSSEGQFFEIRKSLDLTGDPTTWTLVGSTAAAASPAEVTTYTADQNATEAKAFYVVLRVARP